MNNVSPPIDAARPTVARWRPNGFDAAVAAIDLIAADDARPILPDLDLWDCWPLEHRDGRTVAIDRTSFWFFLSAPRFDDPGQRHDQARIRLIRRDAAGWTDLGRVIAEGATPGSREWAGSAVLDDDLSRVTLFFTAAGRRDSPGSFEQRLFETSGRLAGLTISDWSVPVESVASDGTRYVAARELAGVPGAIKAFRDPAFFNDPATGHDHLFFTGSAGWDNDAHNGLVGRATRIDGRWRLDDPVVEAVGVNNELERPHVRRFDGRYYLFFSTQRRTFADPASAGPNGLYALSASRLGGPWSPVNGSGLVAANPPAEPTQAYSWWVEGDGRVASFIDHWGRAGRSFASHPGLLRSQFGGTPAPEFRLDFAADRVTIRR